MANIYDYLKWRGDLSFRVSPFNEVDNLILAELAYLKLNKIINKKKITIQEAINLYFQKYDEKEILKEFALSKNPIPFFKKLANSKRFCNLKILNYVNKLSKKEEKQFSCMMIELNYKTVYVAFRGTDNTLVGWKEDFNMCFMNEIPSQQEAVHYLNQNITFKYRTVYLGGHSKGGNLAIYAAINCKNKITKRIRKIYNNDGPGFSDEITSSLNYLNILPKVTTIIPETSIIGMLLTHKEEYKVVKSDALGIWQHDCLSWQVSKDHFITIKEVNETSNKIREMINTWLQTIDKKKREVFINALFNLLTKNKMDTVESLAKLKLRKIPGLVKEYTKIDAETKKIIMEVLKELMREANKNFDRKTIFHGLRTINKKN